MSDDLVLEEYEPGHQLKLSHAIRSIGHIAANGERGLTTKELGQLLWPGNTSASSWACSPLNKLRNEGKIVLLAERRNGSRIYVLPSLVKGREISPIVKRGGHCDTCTCS